MPLHLTEDIEQPGHHGQLVAAHGRQKRLHRSKTIGSGAAESSTKGEDGKPLDVRQGEPANAPDLADEQVIYNHNHNHLRPLELISIKSV